MHFFIDHTQLSTQASADTFAPESSDPTNKFNITSRFQLTGQTKAFACQKSLMIVQQSSVDSSLVNVILKPIEGLKIPFKSVKYFVYRGLLKNSFISGTAITPQATGNSEFIARFWTEWNTYKTNTNQPTLTDPTPQSFGYDTSLAGSLDIENIYDNSQTDVRAILVQAGEWIGDFGSSFKIGFEIITEDDNLTLDLDFLRAKKYQIDVTSLTGLELRATREQILSFIDPAAFFGLHYDVGVNISTYSGSNKTTAKKKQNDIYSFLLDNKFATRNRVYLDIRSEKGFSYNFYQNYDDGSGNNIKIGNSSTTPIAQNYSTNDWPIVFVDTPITTTANNNDIKINLRIDDNTKPILFFENTDLLGTNKHSRFLRENEILNGTETDWSKDLTFKVPNTGAGSAKDNVAYYININYFRQEHNPSSPNTVLKNETYFDSTFCPVDLPNLADNNFVFKHIYNPDLTFLRGQFPNEITEFGYIADSGAIWDNTRIVFYAQAVFQVKNSGKSVPSVPTFATNPGLNLTGNFPQISFLNKEISVVSNKINESGVENVEILEFIHYSGLPAFKENIVLLCITQTELQTLKSLSGLSDKHKKYIFIEELVSSPFSDANGVSFRKFELKLQGLDSSGVQTIVAPLTSIYVYSKDGFTFNSKDFGSAENIDNKTKISRIYGNRKVFEWRGYIDDSREVNVRQLLENTCITIPSIFPTLLFTIATGEGLNLWIDANYDPSPPNNVMINNRINGFNYLGTDDFGGDFSRYQPFLPTTYNEGDEFDIYNATNELGQPVISADFKNLESGLLGIGAVIAHRKNKFLTDASGLGYSSPNIDQIVFWTYIYFQGEGRGKNYLIANKGFDFAKEAPLNMRDIRRLALERLATWRYIKISNLLSI